MSAVARPRTNAWEKGRHGWAVVFVIVVVVAEAVAWTDTISIERKLVSSMVSALLLAVYLAFGRRFISSGNERGSLVYLAVALPLAAVLMIGIAPEFLFLLSGLFPQVFMASRRVAVSVAGAAILSAISMVAIVVATGSVTAGVLEGIATLAGAIFVGLWIGWIITESGQRAELIEQLEAARSDLSIVSHEAGVLAERQRLAHEIHDTLAQGFTSIVMLAQAGGRQAGSEPVGEQFELIERTARENLAEARALMEALSPPQLQASSLAAAAERLADRARRELDTDISIEVAGTPRLLPALQEVALLRALQESLTNIGKHAGARNVTVCLDYRGLGTSITVSDNGCGFVPARVENGFGLVGMQARLATAGGRADISSSVGRGTTVVASIP